FALYDQATMPNGQVDYDLLEQLQAEYLEENPGVQAKIDKFIGVYDDPVMQEFRRAQQQAREYYQIPAYRGMTIEDSRRATEVLNLVNAYVAAGEAANRRHAYQLVVARGLVTEEDVRLAIEAVKRGTNPERKKFRAEHAEFRKFYTD